MLDFNYFSMCINKMALTQNLTFSPEWLVAMHEELNPYFDKDSFGYACREILHHEGKNLYGKMPTLTMFMDYCPNKPKSLTSVANESKQAFLNKVGDYLSDNFHTDDDRAEFNGSLTIPEARALQSLGGMANIWESCHRPDMPRAVSSILKDLGEAYENNYSLENCGQKVIENRIASISKIGNVTNKLLENFKTKKADNDEIIGYKGVSNE